MKTKQILTYSFSALLLTACGTKQATEENQNTAIEITRQQFDANQMQLGKVEPREFKNLVHATGSIVSLPNGSAEINAPISGLIKRIHFSNGQFVNQGQTLMEISGFELIDLQKEFAVNAARLKQLKKDYDRNQQLYHENAKSEKDLMATEAEYKSTLATYNGLKLKIESLGLPLARVEAGDFFSSYPLRAPISGYIFQSAAAIGTNVEAQNMLLKIINPQLLQIKLEVFPNKISQIKKGQEVLLTTAEADSLFRGTISSIGVGIDQETKSIPCFASIQDKGRVLPVENMFVQADIVVRAEMVQALPKSALIKTENNYYVLQLQKQEAGRFTFEKKAVRTGREYENYVEILNNDITGQVLTQGAYYVQVD